VLGLIVAKTLYTLYPKKPEGFLSKLKAYLVSRHYLNRVGKQLGLDQWMDVVDDVRKHSEDYLGNAVEALIGALFLDQGIESVESFVRKHILEELLKEPNQVLSNLSSHQQDPVSSLFTLVHQQKLGEVSFRYEVIPKGFRCKLYLSDHYIAEGEGRSKRVAKKKAAEVGLKFLNLLPQNDPSFGSAGD